ncbi:MAG TPA: hypothetical protein VLG37_01080 [Candidatus Saccharimonadales bacterium]|nr:hypothetical protein [Candidatus Saccharimonadales bacterium]
MANPPSAVEAGVAEHDEIDDWETAPLSLERDGDWIANFDLVPDEALVADLQELAIRASQDITGKPPPELRDTVHMARRAFYTRLGLSNFIDLQQTARSAYPSLTLVPPDNFIGAQRYFNSIGVNGARAISRGSGVFTYTYRSIKATLETCAKAGLDGPKILAVDSSIIGSKAKIQAKVAWLEQAATELNWTGNVRKLAEEFPGILGFDIRKLQMLRRIAALACSIPRRNLDTQSLANALKIPLENYIAALAINDFPGDVINRANKLQRQGREQAAKPGGISAKEWRRRKALAAIASGKVPGDIVEMYLEYAPLKAGESFSSTA